MADLPPKTLLPHTSGILNWWERRLSTGKMERANNKIRTPPAEPTDTETKPSSFSICSPFAMPRSNLSDERSFQERLDHCERLVETLNAWSDQRS